MEGNSHDIKELQKLDNPSELNKPKMTEVYKLLVDELVSQWYDIFAHLDIERDILDRSARDNPLEDHSSLLDMIIVWLQRDEPSATWEALENVLRYKLLVGNVADKIKEKYSLVQESEDTGEKDEKTKGPAAHFDEDGVHFSKLLLDITEQLGPDSFVDLYHCLKEIRCLDGTRMIHTDILQERRSPDGLLIPLVYNSLCNCRDIDVVLRMLKGLSRENMNSMVQNFVPKVGMGNPIARSIHDPNKFLAINLTLQPTITQIDLVEVSNVKQILCYNFSVKNTPHLLQFIGWKAKPLTLRFQAPLACIDQIMEGIANKSVEFQNIATIELDIKSIVFKFNFIAK